MSNYELILTECKAAIDALSLGIDCAIRKRFIRHEADPASLILVCPLEEEEVGDVEGFEDTYRVEYPVLVVMIVADGNLQGPVSAMLTLREAVRYQLRAISAIALNPPSSLLGARVDTRPAFDKTSVRNNEDVSAMIFHYVVEEGRRT